MFLANSGTSSRSSFHLRPKWKSLSTLILMFALFIHGITITEAAAAALCTSTSQLLFRTTFSSISIANGGDSPISITSLSIRDDNPKFAINPESISNTSQLVLPISLAPKQSLELQLAFYPGAHPPPHLGVLDIDTDSATVGRVSVALKGVDRPENMKIEVLNLDAWDEDRQHMRPGFWNDYVVFNKIRDGLFVDGFTFSISDSAVVRLKNRHATDPVAITGMTLSNNMWVIKRDNASFTIPPNSFVDITLQFVSREGQKGRREAIFTITTDDIAAPTINIILSCGYMEYREDTNELSLSTIIDVYGFQVNTYRHLAAGFMALPWLRTSRMVGDEVRSRLWERADLTKPIYVRSLAAFLLVIYKKPEAETMNILGEGGGQVTIDPKYGQSLLPRAFGKTTPAEGFFNTTGPFAIVLAHNLETTGWSSDNAKDLNEHMFPLRDRTARVYPDTYLVVHDFILPRGCCVGLGCANCDYQDNVYMISNMKPSDNDTLLPPHYQPGDPELTLTFEKTIPGTLVDKSGNGIGFTGTQNNDDDVTPGSGSFNPTLLELDASQKKLIVTSALGTNVGAINRQVNALQTWFDAEGDPYYVLARLEGPFSQTMTQIGQESCVWLGSNKDNYAKLCITFDESLGHSFMFILEIDSVPTPPLLLKLDGVDSIRTLDLFLLVTPESRMIVPAYSINGNSITSLSSGSTVRSNSLGYFFGPRIRAGILTSHAGGGAGFKSTFLRFSVTPDKDGAEIKRQRTYALGVKGQDATICTAFDPKPPSVVETPSFSATPSHNPFGSRSPSGVESPLGSSGCAPLRLSLFLIEVFIAALTFLLI